MIENLNETSFNPFGRIYNLGFKEACVIEEINMTTPSHLNLTSKSVSTLVCSENSCSVLEVLEGLALLCVSKKPGSDKPRVFLLDKTVSIDKGVFYTVVPLYSVCSVLLGKNTSSSITEFSFDEDYVPIEFNPKVNINKIYTIFYQEKNKNFLFKGEKHNFWELTYVDKGILHSNVDGKTYITEAGELIFYGENQYHMQWCESEPVSFITITFDMYFDNSADIANRLFTVGDELKTILQNIIYEKDKSLYCSNDIILCYLKILIIKLLRNDSLENTLLNVNNTVKNKIENSIVSKTLEYIHNNIGNKLSICSIAAYVHLSPSYLSTLFKKNMDMTIVDYINKHRLEKSKELIKTSSYSITHIAEMLGYTSIHYFSRLFKAHFGMSPSTYASSIK